MKRKMEKMLSPRTELMALLDSLDSYPILYIQAPAGYGKTVSAGLWLKRRKMGGATVSLDEYDNAMLSFCRKFCAGVMVLYPHHPLLRELFLHPDFESAPEEYTIRGVAALSPKASGILVMDDLHFIEDDDVLRFLTVLCKRMPDKVRILILSRAKPPDCFAELLLKDKLATIGAEQMQFSGEEIFSLYRDYGYILTKQQAQQIYALTEGWPIAINAILLSGEVMPEKKLMHRQLENFLQTQVWERWDADAQRFLLQTALEEELTPELCAALTGGTGSKERLEFFVRSSSFVLKTGESHYSFHSLFRAFLLRLFEEQSVAFQEEQLNRAGEWHYEHGDYYRAIDCLIKSSNEDGILRCIQALSQRQDRFHIEKMLAILRNPTVTAIIDKHPTLLWANVWTAYLGGRPREMEHYLDEYYKRFPEILAGSPREIFNFYYISCIDYRNSMWALAGQAGEISLAGDTGASPGAITQHMPLFHRSFRDFSECVGDDLAGRLQGLKAAIGNLLGKEQDMFEACLRSGLHYERGELTEAHSAALTALALIQGDFAAESKFCAMIGLVQILRAQWQYDRARLMVEQIENMIETEKAFYLSYNLEAYLCRCRLEDGELSAAERWIEKHHPDPFEHVTFHRLYGHFTTARAYITIGSYDKAIVVLKKILELGQSYRRPLDVIEARLLLAIAFWKKKRGHQQEAMAHLEEAVMLAHPYGYTQVFVNEGPELLNMLHRLQTKAIRQNYTGNVSGSFAKGLYMLAMGHAKHTKGLTGGRTPEDMKFTERQKQVMALLCEGNSYRRIAEKMGIQFSTVRSHMELIYKKLDVPGETEAVLKIKELRLLDE